MGFDFFENAMGFSSTSSFFTSPDTDPGGVGFDNDMNVKSKSTGRGRSMNSAMGSGEAIEPYIGLEFDSPDDARQFYNMYGMRVGFRTRIGQLYRSRTDGSVASRRYVCQSEGFQVESRCGCPAFIRVKRCDSGKWVIDQMDKDHNHKLMDLVGQGRIPVSKRPLSVVPPRRNTKVKMRKTVDDGGPFLSGAVNVKRFRMGAYVGQFTEPYSGLVFNSAEEAYHFYQTYAEKAGFKVRIGQLFRSKQDGSITSRRYVCSKEGFQHPSRVGCGAFMRIKMQKDGTWIVDKFKIDHNHETGLKSGRGLPFGIPITPKQLMDEGNGGLDFTAPVKIENCVTVATSRDNVIGNEWYSLLLDYFQTRQAQDTGFFYSLEVVDGSLNSIFWADGRSRFSGSQFGDVIVFDTSYREKSHSVPFAMFLGVNHHRQPVILGCALIASESKEAFTWLFQTWLKAMSGHCPKSIIADQDAAIQQAVALAFPGTHHCFSLRQFKSKEQENLRSMSNEFRCEYEECISQSRTPSEFTTTWTALVSRHGLEDSVWLQQLYEKRECWVPMYLRGSFFAGIPANVSLANFSSSNLLAQAEPGEFILQYEQVLEQQREEERREDFKCWNLEAVLQTKEPVEDQCRRLYTLAMFKVFQEELMQCCNYFALKTFEERTISRFLLQRCGNENEKHAVCFDRSNLDINCSCKMFEFEGVICRHALTVLNLFGIRELPSRYILHRWTKNAIYGTPRDALSLPGTQELEALMTWSLRETAQRYIEAGSTSLEKYRIAYEVMNEVGASKLRWQ